MLKLGQDNSELKKSLTKMFSEKEFNSIINFFDTPQTIKITIPYSKDPTKPLKYTLRLGS